MMTHSPLDKIAKQAKINLINNIGALSTKMRQEVNAILPTLNSASDDFNIYTYTDPLFKTFFNEFDFSNQPNDSQSVNQLILLYANGIMSSELFNSFLTKIGSPHLIHALDFTGAITGPKTSMPLLSALKTNDINVVTNLIDIYRRLLDELKMGKLDTKQADQLYTNLNYLILELPAAFKTAKKIGDTEQYNLFVSNALTATLSLITDASLIIDPTLPGSAANNKKLLLPDNSAELFSENYRNIKNLPALFYYTCNNFINSESPMINLQLTSIFNFIENYLGKKECGDLKTNLKSENINENIDPEFKDKLTSVFENPVQIVDSKNIFLTYQPKNDPYIFSTIYNNQKDALLKHLDNNLTHSSSLLSEKNLYGDTPLMYAVRINNLEAANILLSKGALPSIEHDAKTSSYYHYEKPKPSPEMQQLLTSKIKKEKTEKEITENVKTIASGTKYEQAIDNLFMRIEEMRKYGNDLAINQHDKEKGEMAEDFARDLRRKIIDYFGESTPYKSINANQFDTFKNEFSAILNKGNQDPLMSTHRKYWKVIVANVALALTIVGAFFVAGKYAYSGKLFFNQTTRQDKAVKIEKALDKVPKPK